MATYTKRGDRWRVQVRRKGVSRSRTFYTKSEGRVWATRVEREIDTGKLAAQTKATLEDAFIRYSDEVSPTKKGARWEQIRLKRFQSDPIADIRLCKLTGNDIMSWRDQRAQEVKPGTVNRELNLLRSVLKACRVRWDWLTADPFEHVERLPSPPPRDRRISDDEIALICRHLVFTGKVETTQHRVAVAFMFAIETGMRLGEICSIRPADVYPRYVRLHRTKNSDRRDVPLSKKAVELINLVEGNFRLDTETASTLFRRARIRAGITDMTFHDSRHEACTRLARKLDVLDLARMIGHRDLRSLRIYFNPRPEEIASRLDGD